MLSVLIFAFVLFIVLLLMILCSMGTSTDTNYYGSGDGGKLEAHDIYHTTGESRF